MAWTAVLKDAGTPLARSFRGCLVWNKQAQAVVGVTVATDHAEGARQAYLLPAVELARRWPPRQGRSR